MCNRTQTITWLELINHGSSCEVTFNFVCCVSFTTVGLDYRLLGDRRSPGVTSSSTTRCHIRLSAEGGLLDVPHLVKFLFSHLQPWPNNDTIPNFRSVHRDFIVNFNQMSVRLLKILGFVLAPPDVSNTPTDNNGTLISSDEDSTHEDR